MFAWLKRRFTRTPAVKNFSTTLTSAREGTQTQRELVPKVQTLLERIEAQGQVSNEDLNTLCAFYFNTPEIKTGLYNLNKAMTDGMCFTIQHVNTVHGPHGEVQDVLLTLGDVIYENNFRVVVSVKDFHESFLSFHPQPITPRTEP